MQMYFYDFVPLNFLCRYEHLESKAFDDGMSTVILQLICLKVGVEQGLIRQGEKGGFSPTPSSLPPMLMPGSYRAGGGSTLA